MLVERARHALWRAVPANGLRPGDEVLAPAYHHGSEIEAILRAGLTCRFYETTPTLAPDEDDLEALLGRRTRALHLIHYLGFPQDADRWRRWCDAHGLLLIEDAAQAWLCSFDGRPVGSAGNIVVFCLYKTFGLPDGAALLSRAPLSRPARRPRAGLVGLGVEHGLWFARRSRVAARLAVAVHRPGDGAESEMALGDPSRSPSTATLLALSRVVDPDAAATRRRYYETLLGGLRELVAPGFARLPPGASPFVFPIQVRDKKQVLTRLARGGIRALDFWSIPHPALPVDRFPAAKALRSTVVGLPVHQELRPADVERIGDAAREAA